MYTMLLRLYAQSPAWFRNGVAGFFLGGAAILLICGFFFGSEGSELVRLPDNTIVQLDYDIPWYKREPTVAGFIVLIVGTIFLLFAGQSKSEKAGYNF